MVKKEPKIFYPIHRPIFIVGEKMGRQRFGQDKYALEGNGTGDFVHEAIGDNPSNIILTNIVNYYYEGNFDHKSNTVDEGIVDLGILIVQHQPRKIITLGGIAEKYIQRLSTLFPNGMELVHMPHPSWINRFQHKHRSSYLNDLKHELNK